MKKALVFGLSILIIFILYFSLPQASFAEDTVDTAIGPISTDPQSFAKNVVNIVLGLSGGIALIMIIISGYKFMISQGNPEALKDAQEQLTSAIVGLLFIILSFVILQMIGGDILGIPGFGK